MAFAGAGRLLCRESPEAVELVGEGGSNVAVFESGDRGRLSPAVADFPCDVFTSDFLL